MPKIRFVGVGSAFAGRELGQSNMVVEADNGKLLLIDCGTRSQDMLEDAYGITNADLGRIDGVYISHAHADHVGGLEWLALCTFFNPTLPRPKLYCEPQLMEELWEDSLRGGLRTLQGPKVATLETYFECIPTPVNGGGFVWEGVHMEPVQVVHVVSGFKIQHCYSLLLDVAPDDTDGDGDGPVTAKQPDALDHLRKRIFLSGDTQFAPEQLRDFYKLGDLILHDCETLPFESRVHAHYSKLAGLEDEEKAKMWLYHYNSPITPEQEAQRVADGFAGFVAKGQAFDIATATPVVEEEALAEVE
jgi:ribonuclease BN (tRNA processing enzyme)